MKVNFISIYPSNVCLEVKDMSRTQCVYDLPLMANDYDGGQVKAWINSWFKRDFQCITLVTLYDADGNVLLDGDTGENRCTITGTGNGQVKLDLSKIEHMNDFIQGHPFQGKIIEAAQAQMAS